MDNVAVLGRAKEGLMAKDLKCVLPAEPLTETADPCTHKDLASSAQSAAIGLRKSTQTKRTQEQISHHPQVLPRTITASDRPHLVVHGCLAAWLHGLLAAWPYGRMTTDRTSEILTSTRKTA